MSKKQHVPRKALQFVYDLAVEMSGEAGYGDWDEETGTYLGPRQKIVDDLEAVRKFFRLHGRRPGRLPRRRGR